MPGVRNRFGPGKAKAARNSRNAAVASRRHRRPRHQIVPGAMAGEMPGDFLRRQRQEARPARLGYPGDVRRHETRWASAGAATPPSAARDRTRRARRRCRRAPAARPAPPGRRRTARHVDEHAAGPQQLEFALPDHMLRLGRQRHQADDDIGRLHLVERGQGDVVNVGEQPRRVGVVGVGVGVERRQQFEQPPA